MSITQIYIPLFVRFPRDPKVRALVVRHGVEGILAAYLYLVMALYCRENLTDGLVPDEEVGALAYPLPVEHAEQLLKLLLEAELIKRSSDGSSNGSSDGSSYGYARGWIVGAYVKINGTREEVEARTARLAEAGRKGGLSRQVNAGDEASAKPGLEWSPSKMLSQTETETEKTSRVRAGARARPPARGTRQPAPSATVLDSIRSGPPATDEQRTARAAEARAALEARKAPPDQAAADPGDDEIPF